MAVYTHLGAGELAELISHYDVGQLVSAKGIAEGISNSNWLIETDRGRYILTMYERRIDIAELPFFLSLLDHLAAKGCPVPATIHDREGNAYRMIDGKAVALIEFLPGVSVDAPTASQAYAVGQALAAIHRASEDFTMTRENDLRPSNWKDLLEQCTADDMSAIDPDLPDIIAAHLPSLMSSWPTELPRGTIHADLFPDNVLLLDDKVSGLIDFYFSCSDFLAYDLAVTHVAWSFVGSDTGFSAEISEAILGGYQSVRQLSADEIAAMPLLAKGAAMRFIATRTFDWIDTPADALVTRKDPMDFVKRLQFYDESGLTAFAPLSQ